MTTERTYNVPLRKAFRKAPRYAKAGRAVSEVRSFLKKHLKAEEVLLGQQLNQELWKHGARNPPHHVKVTAVKDDDGVVRAEIQGVKYLELKQKPKKEDDTTLMGKLKSKMGVEDVAGEGEEQKTEGKGTERKTGTTEGETKKEESAKAEAGTPSATEPPKKESKEKKPEAKAGEKGKKDAAKPEKEPAGAKANPSGPKERKS